MTPDKQGESLQSGRTTKLTLPHLIQNAIQHCKKSLTGNFLDHTDSGLQRFFTYDLCWMQQSILHSCYLKGVSSKLQMLFGSWGAKKGKKCKKSYLLKMHMSNQTNNYSDGGIQNKKQKCVQILLYTPMKKPHFYFNFFY